MCGIAGILRRSPASAPVRLEPLARMAGALAHRGPDERGAYLDAHCGLAHTRLSIVDLAAGQQPMGTADGRRFIVFNGEIFNHLELREELRALGETFRTRSDTEVALVALARWGDEAFARFNGQFAIALWDAAERTLLLGRDRVGVRPLHLCEHAGRLHFASEVKALFAADPSIPRAFDPAGLAETFTFWSPVPPRTPFRGVAELEPGHLRRYRAGGEVEDRAWWTPRYPGSGPRFEGSIGEATEAVGAALREATRLRMVRADVPVGAYVSGGLDSALTAALAHDAVGGRFHTFSLRFEDAEYDEGPFQRLVTERIGSEHHEVVVRRGDIARAFPEVVSHAERPLLRTAPAPLWVLSRLVRQHGIKVVLTGEGADEMFGGYDLFREGKVRRFWARRPGSRLRPLLLRRLYPYLARSPVAQQATAERFFGRDLDRAGAPGFAHGIRWQSAAALQRLFHPDLRAAAPDVQAELLASLPEAFARWEPLAQDQYLEVRTLLSGYLLSSQGDRMLMAHSVEGRFPFLDAEVIALANSLPASHKLRGLDEKHVLKRVARGRVPDAVVERVKQPYRAPDALSFVGPDAPEYVGLLLSEAEVRAAGVFEPAAIARLFAKCARSAGAAQLSNADNMALVGALSTQLLHDRLLRRTPEPAPPPRFETLVDRTKEA